MVLPLALETLRHPLRFGHPPTSFEHEVLPIRFLSVLPPQWFPRTTLVYLFLPFSISLPFSLHYFFFSTSVLSCYLSEKPTFPPLLFRPLPVFFFPLVSAPFIKVSSGSVFRLLLSLHRHSFIVHCAKACGFCFWFLVLISNRGTSPRSNLQADHHLPHL